MNMQFNLVLAALAAATISLWVVSAEGQKNGNVRGGVVQEKNHR